MLALLLAAQLSAEEARWNAPAAPFRIADGLYYVGTADLASYLFVDRAGMILLDGGLEASAPLILGNIRALGFDPKQVRYLINSQAHYDHAGGLKALKDATGAKLLASGADADLLERGGAGDFAWGDELTYPAVKVDGRLRDGQVLKLGALRLTPHLTPGHTRGCTSWTMRAKVDGRATPALFICGASAPGYKLLNNSAYPEIMTDFRRSFAKWRTLPCDLFLGAHASYYGMTEKRSRLRPGAPNPFVDPAGCRAFLARAEQRIAEQAAKEARACSGQMEASGRSRFCPSARREKGPMLSHRDRRATLQWGKIGPPLRGRPQEPGGRVACLRVAPLRVCAALLATGLLRAIPMFPSDQDRPKTAE